MSKAGRWLVAALFALAWLALGAWLDEHDHTKTQGQANEKVPD